MRLDSCEIKPTLASLIMRYMMMTGLPLEGWKSQWSTLIQGTLK